MTKYSISDIAAALGLLSRLPMPLDAASPRRNEADAAWAYPVAGAVIGAVAALAGWIAGGLGLPVTLQAAVVLAMLIILTGAMHEDGLADSADGLWGGWEPARRLEIMRDSRIGTYGVIALILSLLIRWSALSTLLAAGASLWLIVGIAALSRAPMVALMAWLPHARRDGLSSGVGRPGDNLVWSAAAIGALVAIITAGWAGIVAVLCVGAAGLGVAAIARNKINGQTGDILGAAQQLSEIAALLCLCAAL